MDGRTDQQTNRTEDQQWHSWIHHINKSEQQFTFPSHGQTDKPVCQLID